MLSLTLSLQQQPETKKMLHPSSAFNSFRTVHALVSPYLEKYPTPSSFPEMVCEHFQQFKLIRNLSKNGQLQGKVFELVIADALIQSGIPVENLRAHVSDATTSTEIDIAVITPSSRIIAILAKTSLRERWKQEDRDALMLKLGGVEGWNRMTSAYALPAVDREHLSIWALTWKEQKDSTAAKAIESARKKGALCGAINTSQFISVFDRDRMNALLEQAKG
jgi:hypothetical protein